MAGNDQNGPRWYVSRKEIEENFPSRKDGIDLKKETYLRKSYCTFLQDLGIKLKVPQVTIATAIVFCHRFFLHQSHAKNDRKTIATVCMFLAGKVEETPRPLKDVILVSHEIIHKRDPVAIQRIKQKEVYEKRKEVILLAERVVLTTLDFDLNVSHPYRPLVAAIKKFNVAQNALAQVAWNFVNDGLRTSLCLQFKPPHIAAGAIFLAAKFLKVKLPTEGDRNWWQEFDITPRQLEDVSNQMLELYEQNRPGQSSQANEGSTGGAATNTVATTTGAENSQAKSTNIQQAAHVAPFARPTGSSENNRIGVPLSQHSGNSNSDIKSGICEQEMIPSLGEAAKDQCPPNAKVDTAKGKTALEEHTNCRNDVSNSDSKSELWEQDISSSLGHDAKDQCPLDANINKVEVAFNKHQKIQEGAVKKNSMMGEEAPVEMGSGNKLVFEHEKLSNSLIRGVPKKQWFEHAGAKDEGKFRVSEQLALDGRTNPKLIDSRNPNNAEEEELSSLDDHETPSPKLRGKITSCRKLPKDMSEGEFHHQLREAPGTGEMDCSHRRLELVNEEGVGAGKPWAGKRLRDFPHPSRESAGDEWMDHSEIDHKRQRLHGYNI